MNQTDELRFKTLRFARTAVGFWRFVTSEQKTAETEASAQALHRQLRGVKERRRVRHHVR